MTNIDIQDIWKKRSFLISCNCLDWNWAYLINFIKKNAEEAMQSLKVDTIVCSMISKFPGSLRKTIDMPLAVRVSLTAWVTKTNKLSTDRSIGQVYHEKRFKDVGRGGGEFNVKKKLKTWKKLQQYSNFNASAMFSKYFCVVWKLLKCMYLHSISDCELWPKALPC